MPKQLKVYRTAAGFHDAYVAAPSMKAALEAWGATRNLFQLGQAELVTDAKLTAAPLSRPGEVIKVTRGDAGAQLAALGKDKPARGKGAKPAKPAKPKPRPSRARLDKAEAALTAGEDRHRAARDRLDSEYDKQRRALDRARDAELTKLRRARERAEDAYEAALADWRE